MAIIEKMLEANDKPRAEIIIDVQILEVSRERAKKYGLNLSSYAIGGIFSPEVAPATGDQGISNQFFNLNTISQGVSTADFYLSVPSAVLNFLESDSRTKVLAKPQLRGTEGQKVMLNLGEDVPIPSTTFTPIATGGAAANPLTSFGYRPIGIIVEMTPRVTYEGEIILELTLENSARGGDVIIAGQALPAFSSRKVTTKLRLRDGEPNLLAGLLREDERKSLTGFPGLLRLPVLQQLFGSTDSNVRQTDIVMLLTPRIVRTHELTAADLAPIYIGPQSNFSLGGGPPPLINVPGGGEPPTRDWRYPCASAGADADHSAGQFTDPRDDNAGPAGGRGAASGWDAAAGPAGDARARTDAHRARAAPRSSAGAGAVPVAVGARTRRGWWRPHLPHRPWGNASRRGSVHGAGFDYWRFTAVDLVALDHLQPGDRPDAQRAGRHFHAAGRHRRVVHESERLGVRPRRPRDHATERSDRRGWQRAARGDPVRTDCPRHGDDQHYRRRHGRRHRRRRGAPVRADHGDGEVRARIMRRRLRAFDRGYTFVELIVVTTIILILASAVQPLVRVTITRQKESELRRTLREMRTAIDKYKDAADMQMIPPTELKFGAEGYPPTLETLVEGVSVANDATGRKLKFLRRVPNDPITGSDEWGMRSYQDKPDATRWGGQNVYDVYSLSEGTALDGTKYRDW